MLDIGTGNGYSVSWTSAHNDFENPGKSKGVGDTWVSIQPGGDYAVSMQYVYDYGRSESTVRSLRSWAGSSPFLFCSKRLWSSSSSSSI